MFFANLFPLGILQLFDSVGSGYFEARALEFLTNDTNTVLEWLRLPGDIVFIAGGALPALYIAYLGIRDTVKRVTLDEPDDILFTEISGITEPGPTRRPRRASHEPEVILAAVYAAALILGALVLEWLSAHTHRRALRYRTAGFTYHEEHDHWRCPAGEHLWPDEVDDELRLVRYRAKAHICNSCHLKEAAPTSTRSRGRAPDRPVAALRGGLFHRGLS